MEELNTTEVSNKNNRNNSKKVIYTILAILILLGLGYAFVQYRHNLAKKAANVSINDITKLNEQEKIKALEAQVSALQDEAKIFGKDATSATKYATLIRWAEAQIELSKFAPAIETLNAIPEDKKDNSRVDLAYGMAYKGVGDAVVAKQFLKKTIDADDTQAKAWVAYLELISNDLKTDQLNNMYREAITKTKSNVDVMISYAHFSEKIGDKATAIAAWETARNVDPNNTDKYNAEITRLKQ